MTPEERETPVEAVPAVPPRPSKRPTERPPLPAPPRRPSGQHPAVVGMRKKLASLVDGQIAAHDELDAKLDEAIARLKTPLPPALPPDDPGDEPTSH